MYFAVMKLTFEPSDSTPQDRKALAALVEKIRARYKVCVMPCEATDETGQASIAISSLGHSDEALSKQLDAISDFCEETGFGRVETERTLMDHIDAFSNDDEDEEDEDGEDGGPYQG